MKYIVQTKADGSMATLAGSVLISAVLESLIVKGKVSNFQSPFDKYLDVWNESHAGYKTKKSGLSYFAEGVRIVDDDGIVHIYKFERQGFMQVHVTINGGISFELLMTIIEGLL